MHCNVFWLDIKWKGCLVGGTYSIVTETFKGGPFLCGTVKIHVYFHKSDQRNGALCSKQIYRLPEKRHGPTTLWRKLMGCSGPQPGCQWSNFSWPGIWFTSVGWIKPLANPEFSRDFWKLVCCTCAQVGIFQEILLPQPGIFKTVSCTCSQTGVFREYSLSQPWSTSKFLTFASKKNCQHEETIHRPSDYQADVLSLHHQFWLIKWDYFKKL